MAEVASAYVSLMFSAKGAGAGISKEINSVAGTAGVDGGNAAGKGFASSFKGHLKGIAGTIATTFAAVKVVDFFKDSFGEAQEAQKVMAQTGAVLKSTGSIAGVSATQVDKLASSLSAKAGVDDELIASGENVLLTFTAVRNEAGKGNDIFNQATSLALDMSTALGVDLKGANLQLGKALNDPIKGMTSLSRAGVSFTQEQKDQVKAMVASGDTLGAQKLIIAELTKEFGGSAEAQATAADKAGVAWGNLKESVGNILMPVVDAALVGFTGLVNFLPQVGAAVASVGHFVSENSTAFIIAAAVITALFLPALISMGVQATINGALVVAAWVAQKAQAIASIVVQSAQVVIMIARWIALGAVALIQGAIVVAQWVAQGVAAAASAVVMAAQVALMIPQWIALGAEAVVRTAIIVAQWVAQGVAAIASGVVMAGQVALMIAGWVALGAASLLQAARVALAWVIAFGPVALIVAGVIAAIVGIVLAWDQLGAALDWTWRSLIKPVWDAIESAANWLWGNVLQPIFDAIGSAWDTVGSVINSVWTSVIKPVFDTIESVVKTILGLFEDVGDAFGKMSDQQAKAKDAVKDDPVAEAYMNQSFSGPMGATGGLLRGPGTGTSDSIRARLSNGEFVVNAKSTARNLGVLHAINSGRKFAAGGLVGAVPIASFAGGGQVTAQVGDDGAKAMEANGAAMMKGLSDGLAAGMKLVQEWLATVQPTVLSYFADSPAWLTPPGQLTIRGYGDGVTAGWMPVAAWFADMPARVLAYFLTALTWLIAPGQVTIQGYGTGLVAAWASVAAWLAGVQGMVGAHFAGSGAWLVGPGQDVTGGLLEGMKRGVNQTVIDQVATAVVDGLKKAFGIASPARAMIPVGEMITAGLLKGVIDSNPSKVLEKVFGSLPNALKAMIDSGKISLADIAKSPKALEAFAPAAAAGGNVSAAGVPGDLQSWILAAMAITGVPASWLAPLTGLAMHESGGNPSAINLWDSNAKAGYPSQGLFQTIPQTFSAYSLGGSITDPVANAVAAIRYILSRYGSIFNIASYTPNGFVGGYEKGGFVDQTGMALVHKGEYVNTADEVKAGLRGNHYEIHVHEQRNVPTAREMVNVIQDVNFLYGGS